VLSPSESNGDKNVIPQCRSFEVEFIGYSNCNGFTVSENGKNKDFKAENNCVLIENISGTVKIRFNDEAEIITNDVTEEATEFLRRYQGDNSVKEELYAMLCEKKSAFEILMYMDYIGMEADIRDALMEILTAS